MRTFMRRPSQTPAMPGSTHGKRTSRHLVHSASLSRSLHDHSIELQMSIGRRTSKARGETAATILAEEEESASLHNAVAVIPAAAAASVAEDRVVISVVEKVLEGINMAEADEAVAEEVQQPEVAEARIAVWTTLWDRAMGVLRVCNTNLRWDEICYAGVWLCLLRRGIKVDWR